MSSKETISGNLQNMGDNVVSAFRLEMNAIEARLIKNAKSNKEDLTKHIVNVNEDLRIEIVMVKEDLKEEIATVDKNDGTLSSDMEAQLREEIHSKLGLTYGKMFAGTACFVIVSVSLTMLIEHFFPICFFGQSRRYFCFYVLSTQFFFPFTLAPPVT